MPPTSAGCWTAYAALIEQEAAAGKKVKEAQKALDAKVAAKYRQLTEAEIKTLVVEDKWLAALAASVQGELDRVSQALTGRIRQLAERYATPLPRLAEEVETLAARVDEHLKKMGFVWKLKPGYKQTEVGVIPEEWEVESFRVQLKEFAMRISTAIRLSQERRTIGDIGFRIIPADYVDGQAGFSATRLSLR